MFAEKSYAAVSVEEIAQRASVSKPVLYTHLGGKEGLYAVIAGQWWVDTRKPPVAKVASYISALARMGLRHLPTRPDAMKRPK